MLPSESRASVASRASRGQVRHPGDPAGVIGDRGVRVDRDDDADRGESADGGDGHPVDASAVAQRPVTGEVGDADPGGDHDRRVRGGLHRLGDARDDHRGRAGLRLPGYLLDLLVIIGGEPLGDLAHHPSDDQPGEYGDPDPQRVCHQFPEDPVGEPECTDGSSDQGEIGATPQSPARIIVPDPYEERADDGGEHAESSDREGEHDRLFDERVGSEDQDGVDDRCRQGAEIGLEEVGPHPRNVTDVVSNVVGDDRRVARVILGDARFHLAHQISSDIGCFGVDASTDPGEQGDRRTAQSDGDDHLGPPLQLEHPIEHEVAEADSEQAKPGDGEAGDRATAVRQRESGRDSTGSGGLGCTRVGLCGDLDTDVSGQRGENCAEDIGDSAPRSAPIGEHDDEGRHPGDEHGRPGVFPAEERHRSRPDGIRKLDHSRVATRSGHDDP